MTQNMFVCDICESDMSSSHYHIPAEMKEGSEIKFVHMECCSAEEIKKNLLSYAQNQIRFYSDIIDLVNDTNMKNIKDFEMKYGNYEEVSQGIRIDRDTYIASLISELKKDRPEGIFILGSLKESNVSTPTLCSYYYTYSPLSFTVECLIVEEISFKHQNTDKSYVYRYKKF